MKKSVSMLVFLLIVTACAQSPESIQPQYVSNIQYLDLECDQLGEELSRNSAALSQATQQQREARSDDIVGVIFLGLPVSTLSGGNVASYVARLKGERNALMRTATEKRCGLDAPTTTEIVGEDEEETASDQEDFVPTN